VSKVVSLAEAIRDLVPDGASVALGCALEPAVPFSAVHELIRQGKRDLSLIGPISDIAFDMLIGAGCVASVTMAWAGNVSAGLGHCYRRAMEQGIPRRIRVFDHSNFTIAQALLAGALGAPYLPTRTLLGSDIPRANGTFKESTSPFDGSPQRRQEVERTQELLEQTQFARQLFAQAGRTVAQGQGSWQEGLSHARDSYDDCGSCRCSGGRSGDRRRAQHRPRQAGGEAGQRDRGIDQHVGERHVPGR